MSERKKEQPTDDAADAYLWDRASPRDAEVERLEELLRPLRFSADLRPLPQRAGRAAPARGFRASLALTAAGALALAAAAALSIMREPATSSEASAPSASVSSVATVADVPTTPTASAPAPMVALGPSCDSGESGLAFQAVQGVPTCGGEAAPGGGQLPKGAWLETDAASRVKLEVADIGYVEIDASSRVRVVETGPAEHRLELARGVLHAKINAPPRLFFVDTKAATAIDLGCEYELKVDDRGAGVLRVLTGYVELERPREPGAEPRTALVPAGAECAIDPTSGPGTPLWSTSSAAAKTAMATFDRTGSAEDLRAALDLLDKKDTLSIFHLIERVPEAQRAELVDRLRRLVVAPKASTRAATIELQPAAIEAWQTTLEPTWFPE